METELLLAPITALEIVGDHLVAGEGPNIAIYSLEPDVIHSVRCSKQVLRSYNIHGIKEQQNVVPETKASTSVAIFGGKSLVVIRLSFQDGLVNITEVFPLTEIHDWIWDLQWLESKAETPSCMALALGHNSVALYDCIGQRVLREVHCQEKCILYSAHLVGSSWDTLVLVAGTVFNQLVIWSMDDPVEGPGRIKPRCRISGHKGVIFSICFMESKNILASASDDRSLRLWGIGDLRAPPDHVPCLLVCYGHQARVWSVRLLRDYIISIGEDSACLVWDYHGEIVQSFMGHKGRGLWAVAVHEGRGWVFTGGADSGIKHWNLKGQRTDRNALVRLNFSSPQREGSPRVVKLVDVNHLLVLTDAGTLYAYDLTSKTWVLILEDSAYRSYGLLEVSELVGGCVLCAMGNLSGQVKIFPLHSPIQSMELHLYEGKVHSLNWAPFPGQGTNTCSLCASGPAGAMLWLEVSCHPHERVTVVVKQCFLLPLCKKRWHTCAVFLPQGEFLLCGDLRGSVMLFACKPALTWEKVSGRRELDHSESHVICDMPELCSDGPVSLLFGLHGKLGVTSVTCQGDFVYSTGRDGCYRQLQVQGQQLQMLRKHKPCRGLEWLEELRFAPDGSTLVLGFHAAHFVLWSATTNETLLLIPCGGGHRSWSYTRCLSAETFAYIKSGDVVMYQSSDAPSGQCVLKESLHGRELTCVCHVGTLRAFRQELVSVLATGSEDNTVNILAFGVQSHLMTQLTTINDHISSVRALAVARNNIPCQEAESISTVLFSAGGRAQIECYRLLLSPSHTSRSGVACQLAHVASHRLDEQWDRMKNKHKCIKMDPETRYMSVVVLAGAENAKLPGPSFFLAAACSDGSVRLFLLLERVQKLWLIAESFHHQHCVLKVQAFVHQTAGGRRRHFLGSAATDGSIAFWDITDTLNLAAEVIRAESKELELLALGTPVLTTQAHSCGVNSLHIQEMAGGHFFVASGSDDGSISLSIIDVNAKSTAGGQSVAGTGICILRTFSRLGAHAAHVTGLKLLPKDFLLSASVDQRLTLWHFCEDSLSFVCSKFCHVADVAALECWEIEGCNYGSVLCGQGLEVLSCSLKEQGAEINGGGVRV
ncbi:WD repeat-containing protein 6 [Sceloporus undulatus]|uniref:WD repeat-containing protein 6 n=1 Tax=Sceloporus undulatus TaxID=8520 RepID=UPI001C4C8E10|nr:WD repeat-containing protein 6 [Sceloporus undulatus]XP_042307273.1 WD repeat-containing protein 6 [Sceloporus undulatus]XP_042307276.1 WD repeat-containing protein 6 [Sceloporus undulatus]